MITTHVSLPTGKYIAIGKRADGLPQAIGVARDQADRQIFAFLCQQVYSPVEEISHDACFDTIIKTAQASARKKTLGELRRQAEAGEIAPLTLREEAAVWDGDIPVRLYTVVPALMERFTDIPPFISIYSTDIYGYLDDFSVAMLSAGYSFEDIYTLVELDDTTYLGAEASWRCGECSIDELFDWSEAADIWAQYAGIGGPDWRGRY